MQRPENVSDLLENIPYIAELRDAMKAEGELAWLVGGCLRDLLLGNTPLDIDVTAEHPEPLARRFAGFINAHVVPMDPERGIWRVAIGPGQYFDFCKFRDEDITGDLHGRDFTLNAIAVRLPIQEDDLGGLYDPFHGLEDLNAGILRMTNPLVFQDDPLRILRAFRFMSTSNFTIENDTWHTLTDSVDRLTDVAPERILSEWWKVCAGVYAAKCLQRMDEAHVLSVLFPELSTAKGITQNAYHHLDVWEHILLTVTNMERFLSRPKDIFQEFTDEFSPVFTDSHRRARLIFLALIHDIGKPVTRIMQDHTIHFYGHEIAGADIASDICKRLRVSREDTRIITTVVRHHLRPLHLMNSLKHGQLSEKAIIKLFDDTGDCMLDILALAMADKTAGQGPAAEPDVQDRLRELYRILFDFYHDRYLPSIETPFLTGNHLTQQLHIEAGPQIGHLLRRARDLQILGSITSHQDAMKWATKHRAEK